MVDKEIIYVGLLVFAVSLSIAYTVFICLYSSAHIIYDHDQIYSWILFIIFKK